LLPFEEFFSSSSLDMSNLGFFIVGSEPDGPEAVAERFEKFLDMVTKEGVDTDFQALVEINEDWAINQQYHKLLING
jgi:hypothetical protein